MSELPTTKETVTLETKASVIVPLEQWNKTQRELRRLRELISQLPQHCWIEAEFFETACSSFIPDTRHPELRPRSCLYCGFWQDDHS